MLQALQHFHDLRLNGHIERCRWFIGDQQLWLADNRHGDHHPLAQPARQFMRILIEAALGIADPDPGQDTRDGFTRRAIRQPAMQRQDFGDLPANALRRVETRHRLLKHHADAVTADFSHAALRHFRQIVAVEQYPARLDAGRWRSQQPHDGLCRHTLAAAGFAHQPQCLALRDIETHVLNHPDKTLLGVEPDCQPIKAEQHAIIHADRLIRRRCAENRTTRPSSACRRFR